MKAKTFEIRDDGTCIPVLAVQLTADCEADLYLIERSGYGRNPRGPRPFVMIWPMASGTATATSDPNAHGGGLRTWPTAHEYIEEHFNELQSGAVVDVEFIKGETTVPKASEYYSRYGRLA